MKNHHEGEIECQKKAWVSKHAFSVIQTLEHTYILGYFEAVGGELLPARLSDTIHTLQGQSRLISQSSLARFPHFSVDTLSLSHFGFITEGQGFSAQANESVFVLIP